MTTDTGPTAAGFARFAAHRLEEALELLEAATREENATPDQKQAARTAAQHVTDAKAILEDVHAPTGESR